MTHLSLSQSVATPRLRLQAAGCKDDPKSRADSTKLASSCLGIQEPWKANLDQNARKSERSAGAFSCWPLKGGGAFGTHTWHWKFCGPGRICNQLPMFCVSRRLSYAPFSAVPFRIHDRNSFQSTPQAGAILAMVGQRHKLQNIMTVTRQRHTV